MKVFQIWQNFKSGPILAWAGAELRYSPNSSVTLYVLISADAVVRTRHHDQADDYMAADSQPARVPAVAVLA